jgi:hypothetical protein
MSARAVLDGGIHCRWDEAPVALGLLAKTIADRRKIPEQKCSMGPSRPPRDRSILSLTLDENGSMIKGHL